MRLLVLTPKFKRALRKFVKRNAELQQRIEDTLQQMEADVFAPALGTLQTERQTRRSSVLLLRL
ncbi:MULTISPECIES: plasmid stabilization system protein [Nostoc]|uniref:plasmid stabilization system protein n=1 Tax=Nostoc TaxID=1177 RepID=UPI001F550C82|nr:MULTISPECIES: plasmid stabilization system protein [Nostoc]